MTGCRRWKILTWILPTLVLGIAAGGCRNAPHSNYGPYRDYSNCSQCSSCNFPGETGHRVKRLPSREQIYYSPHGQGVLPVQHHVPQAPGVMSQTPFAACPDGSCGVPGQFLNGVGPIPTELNKVSHPAYTVAPPDILFLDAHELIPRPPYHIRANDILAIQVSEPLPNQPIAGKYIVTPEGTINLGFRYGLVNVGGLTLNQVQQTIQRHLSKILTNPQVIVALERVRGVQQVRGEHLVRPDGTITLGSYGNVYVAGMTLDQIRCVVEKHLSQYVISPRVAVDVFAYNSKKYYIIADGAGFGQAVISLPYTGNETVLDAISMINGLPAVASKKYIWVARPGPAHLGCSQILPVDWRAITENGQTKTNWQLLPGDRVYIKSDHLIRFDNNLSKLLRPIERLLGITLLGSTTYNQVRGNNVNNGVLIGG